MHLKSIKPLLPKKIINYYEPFIGGGAVAFNLGIKGSHLNDISLILFRFYTNVYKNTDYIYKKVLEIDKKNRSFSMINKRKYFHYLINLINHPYCLNKDYCAYFIFITKVCFMGLLKSTKSKMISADFDPAEQNLLHPKIEKDNFYQACEFLKTCKITNKSYRDIPITKNSFYFLDPPYFLGFDMYRNKGFINVKELKQYCDEINKIGSKFMLFNWDFIKPHFKEYNFHNSNKIMAINKFKRKEIICTNY